MAAIFESSCRAAAIGVLVIGGLMASEVAAQSSSSALANAMQQSRRSGKPIFAVAGSDSCPACKSLMERLKTDESLSEFADHYVAVSVTYGQDSVWSEWDRKYPIQRNAIPRLYIVRSDGKQIYADAGAPQGESLVTLLRKSLEEAGTGLSEKASAALEQAVVRARSANEADDLIGQAVAIAEVEGAVKSANSFHPTVRQFKELFDEFTETLRSQSTESNAKLSGDEVSFEQVLAIVEVASAYELFSRWRTEANETMRVIRKRHDCADRLKQAEPLVSARVMASKSDVRARSRAAGMYAAVLKRYPETAAATLARAELEQLDADHIALKTPSVDSLNEKHAVMKKSQSEYRTWSSSDGKFSRRAALLQRNATHVQLQGPSGEKFTVEISQLSESDRNHLSK